MRYLLLVVLSTTAVLAANPVERLQTRIDAGEVDLAWHERRGYLDAVLQALEISPLTQTLVFSKTSAQFRMIRPESPRALYFNDDVYVGWVRGGTVLEISTADTERGAAFYTIEQRPQARPRLIPDRGQCLQCHESARTLGVPGHLTRSVHPAPDGQPAYRLGTTNVDQRTPFLQRFGGWYVSGAPFEHLGNRVLADGETLASARAQGVERIRHLDDYLRPDSDIVAHLLLIHQTQMHNRIARAGLEARKAIAYREELSTRFGEVSPESAASIRRRIEHPAEELLRMLLFADESPLPAPLGPSQLAESVNRRGNLYRLDLDTRLLRTPVSYLVRSAAFQSLPPETLGYLRRRLAAIMQAEHSPAPFAHIGMQQRTSLRKLLREQAPWLVDGMWSEAESQSGTKSPSDRGK